MSLTRAKNSTYALNQTAAVPFRAVYTDTPPSFFFLSFSFFSPEQDIFENTFEKGCVHPELLETSENHVVPMPGLIWRRKFTS